MAAAAVGWAGGRACCVSFGPQGDPQPLEMRGLTLLRTPEPGRLHTVHNALQQAGFWAAVQLLPLRHVHRKQQQESEHREHGGAHIIARRSGGNADLDGA